MHTAIPYGTPPNPSFKDNFFQQGFRHHPCDSPLETGTEFLQTIRNNKSIIEITNLDESIGRYRRSVIIDGSKLPENITGPVKLTVL